jgi:hypothetical protein
MEALRKSLEMARQPRKSETAKATGVGDVKAEPPAEWRGSKPTLLFPHGSDLQHRHLRSDPPLTIERFATDICP